VGCGVSVKKIDNYQSLIINYQFKNTRCLRHELLTILIAIKNNFATILMFIWAQSLRGAQALRPYRCMNFCK
jgi:hypothetical protein